MSMTLQSLSRFAISWNMNVLLPHDSTPNKTPGALNGVHTNLFNKYNLKSASSNADAHTEQ